ncbi:MAG: S-layer homology domain-containing protein [Acidimicrobiia bacterium]|nr:S-layer homology domain-containing protein [Acidimicrobiia bacterium]
MAPRRLSPTRAASAALAVLLLAPLATLAPLAAPAAAATASIERTYASAAPAPLGRYLADRYGQAHNARSSTAVGDVTGDGVLDLVNGAPNGFVYIYRATDGVLQRQIEVGVGPVTSSPTLTDLNDDGRLDIVVGLMPTNEAAAPLTIGGYDGATGALLFSKKTCTFMPGQKPCNVFSTIAAADVDGNGDEDIVATSQDHFVHAWRDDGSYLPGFPVFVYDSAWSSPSVADLDGDGGAEIIVLVDLDKGSCANNPSFGCPADAYGSFIWVLESDGRVSDRRLIPGEITISSPAVGDVNGDGAPDIVFTSGSFFRFQAGATGADRLLHALDRNLDDLFAPRALRNASQTSPALADVDGGGGQEIVVTDDEGWLRVYDGAGAMRWERCGRIRTDTCLSDRYGATPSSGLDGSPVAADVDGDGAQEIVYVGEATLRVYDGATGAVEYERLLYLDPLTMGNQVSTPAIFSMGGRARIAFHVLWDQGPVGRDASDHDGVFLFTSASDLGRADWPAFRGDPRSRQGSQGVLRTRRFSDIAGNAHAANIERLAALGVTSGFPDGTFRPDSPVTRAQMAAFLKRAYFLGDAAGQASFPDTVGNTHEAAIRDVVFAGVAAGTSDGLFHPERPVTRGQMAAFLARAERLADGGARGFCDTAGHTFEDEIRAVAGAGIAAGGTDGCFRPDATVTRGQMATFLVRAVG